MKREASENTSLLNRAGVDRISEDIWEFLQTLTLENRNRIRIRFALEDTLLRICEQYDEQAYVTVYMDSRLKRDYISVEYEGELYNPVAIDNGEDEFSRRLLVDMGFAPLWSRKGSRNRITLRIHEERRFATMSIPLSVLAGILFGGAFYALPDPVGDYIDVHVLTLFFNAFLGVLGTFASLSLFLFLGSALGVGLLVMGDSAGTLRRVVTQGNSLVNFLMESVARYSPLFISLTIISHIWNGQISQFYGIWKPIGVFLIAVLLMLFGMLFYTARKYNVSWKWMLKTLKPAMMASLLTASAGASYGETENIVTRKFGISPRLTDFALPIGQTMFMPATICSFIATAFYLTEIYEVHIDLTWLIVATVICTMMAIALQPSADPVQCAWHSGPPRAGTAEMRRQS